MKGKFWYDDVCVLFGTGWVVTDVFIGFTGFHATETSIHASSLWRRNKMAARAWCEEWVRQSIWVWGGHCRGSWAIHDWYDQPGWHLYPFTFAVPPLTKLLWNVAFLANTDPLVSGFTFQGINSFRRTLRCCLISPHFAFNVVWCLRKMFNGCLLRFMANQKCRCFEAYF